MVKLNLLKKEILKAPFRLFFPFTVRDQKLHQLLMDLVRNLVSKRRSDMSPQCSVSAIIK